MDRWCCWMHPDPFLFSGEGCCCLPQTSSTDSLGSMNDMGYLHSVSEPSSPTAAAPVPDDWVRCNECNRWRRLPSDVAAGADPGQWCCAMHPDPLCRSCKPAAAALRTPKHFGYVESPALRPAGTSKHQNLKSLSGAMGFLHRQAGHLL